MEVKGHAYLLKKKKSYFVVALRLSHGFQSCRDIATASCWTLHTGARCLIVLKEKKKNFPIIYDNFDKDNYQKSDQPSQS